MLASLTAPKNGLFWGAVLAEITACGLPVRLSATWLRPAPTASVSAEYPAAL
jgi:hypothetical protein